MSWRAQADDAAGRLLESLIRTHHRRRMARNSSSSVLDLDPHGAAGTGGAPVRHGNSVEVLVDGEAAFSSMLDTIRGARRSVHIAGWHAMPDFAMTRGNGDVTLGGALREAATRAEVRVLLWGGAQLPVIHPTRSDSREARDGFDQIPGVVAALDHREYLQHCHHEKLVVVDGEIAYVGGLDLTHLTNDRWDTQSHEPRSSLGWHDAATRLRGPVVADVGSHFTARWNEVTGERLPAPDVPSEAGPYDVQFVRTVPERIYGFLPRGEFSVLTAYRQALAEAQHLVYLENQFLWAPEIVDILEDKLLHPPSADFRMILLLPRRPATGRDTTLGQLSRLVQADVDHRLLAATLQSVADESPGTYVHAKVGIVDDRWLTIGSTNLNAHSLFNDTEANIVVTDSGLVRETRLRLWREHLGTADVEGDTARLFDDTWVRLADEELARRRDGKSPTHRLCRLEDVSARRDLVLGGLLGLIVDG